MRFPYKTLSVIALSLSSVWFGACSSKKISKGVAGNAETVNSNGNGNVDGGASADGEEGEDPIMNPNDKVQALQGAFGLLNFRQLQSTFATLTGATLANAAVLAEYNKQLSALPNDYAPAAISASKVSAATNLAAQYCDIMSTTPALLSARFPGLSLAAAPTDSAAFAKTLLDGFYGPENALQGPRATDVTSIAQTVDALKGLNGTGPAIFMATCAAVLAGAEFYLY